MTADMRTDLPHRDGPLILSTEAQLRSVSLEYSAVSNIHSQVEKEFSGSQNRRFKSSIWSVSKLAPGRFSGSSQLRINSSRSCFDLRSESR